MAQPEHLLVGDELYVNAVTLEALSDRIEDDVKKQLRRKVGIPFVLIAILAIGLGVLWFIPQQITTQLREDPVVGQRIRDAAEAYLATPAGTATVRQQVELAIGADKGLQSRINKAASEAVSQLDVASEVSQQIDAKLTDEQLAVEVGNYLTQDAGKAILRKAALEYLASGRGQEIVEAATTREVQSATFQNLLIDELENILKP